MKHAYKGALVLILLCLLLPPKAAIAESNGVKYAIRAVVSADKTIAVEETLEFSRGLDSGDFVYHIPLKTGTQVDSIENVIVEGTSVTIQSSDDDITVTFPASNETVHIEYTRIPASDSDTTQDYLALRIIPDISLPIKTATFSVAMPGRFDQQALSVNGIENEGMTGILDYSIVSGVLSGSVLQPLPPNSPIESAFTLVDGYFIQQSTVAQAPQQPQKEVNTNELGNIAFWGLVVLNGLSALLFLITRTHGRESVSGMAPTGFDPAQAGYILRGYANNGDLVALLPYWAWLGVIRMELLPDRRIRFTRVGELPKQASAAQQSLFSALFDNREELTLGSLPCGFRAKLNQTRNDTELEFERSATPIFTKSSLRAKAFSSVCLFISIATLVFFALPMGSADMLFEWIIMSMVVSTIAVMAILPLLTRLYTVRVLPHSRRILFALSLSAIIAILLGLTIFAGRLRVHVQQLLLTACAASILQIILILFSRRRTHAGIEQYKAIERILTDIKNPPPYLSPAGASELYAYSVSLNVRPSAEITAFSDVRHTLKDMQTIWNRLQYPLMSGWRFYYQP